MSHTPVVPAIAFQHFSSLPNICRVAGRDEHLTGNFQGSS